MAASYEIKQRFFILRLEDSYTMDDILNACEQAFRDPDFPDHALAIMDVRHSTVLKERRPEDLRFMAGKLAALSSRFGSRLALAAGNQLYYGMMRMAEVFSESSGMTARAFITIEEAEAWLLTSDRRVR